MNFFATPASETDLFPHQDPEVVRLQAALDAAQQEAVPHAKAWDAYRVRHYEDVVRIPWPKDKAALAENDLAAQQVVAAAAAARDLALTAATERAKEAWDERIRQAFIADQSIIEQFIAVLERHEQLVTEAAEAGVSHVLHVPRVFLSAAEVATRLTYARKELGLT